MLPSCDAARQNESSHKCCCNVLPLAPAEMHTLLTGRLLAVCCAGPLSHPLEELTHVLSERWCPCLKSLLRTCPAAPGSGPAHPPTLG